MSQVHHSSIPKTPSEGNLLLPQQLLCKMALAEPDGFKHVMALIGHFSDTQLSTPLNSAKCREKTAVFLGYPKYSLFLKDFKAQHALRAAIDKLQLEELRLALEETYRNYRGTFQVRLNVPNDPVSNQLRELYSKWTKRLSEALGPRDIQADARTMADYLSQLCGVPPRIQIATTQRFERCDPEQMAMDHIRRHGLFLTPRNQGKGFLHHNPDTDFKLAITPSAVYIHQCDSFVRPSKTRRLRISATPDNVLTLSTLQIALNQIHLMCPELDQCYLVPTQLPDILTQFLECEPESLTLHYTVPEPGQAPKPVVLDITSEVLNLSLSRRTQNLQGGFWSNVDIEPQPLLVNTGRPPWEHPYMQPDYPILD